MKRAFALCILGTLAYRDDREGSQIQSQIKAGSSSTGDLQLPTQSARGQKDVSVRGLPLTPIGVTADGKAVSLATRRHALDASASSPRREPAAQVPAEEDARTLGATPHFDDGSAAANVAGVIPILEKIQTVRNLSFGIDAFGMPLPLPPAGDGECLARTVVLHFEGVKDMALDKKQNAEADEIMYALCAGSLLALLFGHVLVTPILIIVSAGTAFHVVFVVLVYTSGDCKIPVYGGLIAMVPAVILASRVVSFGFFAIGAAAGAVFGIEGQNLLFNFMPDLKAQLEVNEHLSSVYYGTTVATAVIFGLIMLGQVQTIFMLATAFIGAYGLEVGIRGLMASKGYDGMADMHGLLLLAVFFFVGILVQKKLGQCCKKKEDV